MGARVHVIYNDRQNFYFKLLALGLFWECVSSRAEAREFATRADAAKMLRKCGKHREGWRVLTVESIRGVERRVS